jgi:hypothetical protein
VSYPKVAQVVVVHDVENFFPTEGGVEFCVLHVFVGVAVVFIEAIYRASSQPVACVEDVIAEIVRKTVYGVVCLV